MADLSEKEAAVSHAISMIRAKAFQQLIMFCLLSDAGGGRAAASLASFRTQLPCQVGAVPRSGQCRLLGGLASHGYGVAWLGMPFAQPLTRILVV